METIINFVFVVEIGVRVWISSSLKVSGFADQKMNIIFDGKYDIFLS